MKDRPVWIALFSQTGTELRELENSIGVSPDIIMTNSKTYNKTDWNNRSWLWKKTHDEIVYWLNNSYSNNDIRKKVIITLHGYLRILPPEICNRYEIYNGHPALINLYPELKGKDPQIRTWQNNSKYPIIGSIVHRVVAEVDAGEIVSSVAYTNRIESENEMFTQLRISSFHAWKWFLRNKLCV